MNETLRHFIIFYLFLFRQNNAAEMTGAQYLDHGSDVTFIAPPPSGDPRPIHDGFATIRSGTKRGGGRCRSSPSVAPGDPKSGRSCNGCEGRVCRMEPLWEERSAPGVILHPAGAVSSTVVNAPRRQRNIPWWEVATRRSKYRSCPAFSQVQLLNS